MPKYSSSPGDFIEITLKGRIVYNAGGFLAITNSDEVYERSKSDTQTTFDRAKGEYYFDLPEEMIVEVKEAHRHPAGTIAMITLPPSGLTMVCEYRPDDEVNTVRGKTCWFQCNGPMPVWVDDTCTVKILWVPGEDG